MLPRTSLRGTSLRTRVLATALVPSVALLLAGVILAGYLISNAVQVRSVMTAVDEATPEARDFFTAVRQERGLTLRALSRSQIDEAALAKARKSLDAAADELFTELRSKLAADASQSVRTSIDRTQEILSNIDAIRDRVDAGEIDLAGAYSYYNKLMDEFAYGLTALAKTFDDAEITYLRLEAMPLFLAADGMARAHSFAAAALASGEMTKEQFRIISGEIGGYHERLTSTEPSMLPGVRSRYEELLDSSAWERLTQVEQAILGGLESGLPMTPQQWQASVTEVGKILGGLYIKQSSHATDLSLERSQETLIWSIVGGSVAVLFGVVVFVMALRSSNRLVRRLTTLRGRTLDIAEQRLPELVTSVRSGKQVDTDTDELRIDAGDDEIGQVADAFNKAQQTAISAAVEEARTREGTRTVFLNIAHRSQVIVHRQLKALDAAERKQDDPDQLDLLFQLDHLSTRARRNAENLIIIGGQQPGRQWRNPVAVGDLVRGAVAETEDYARVTLGKLPDVAVQGSAVGDVVHLLAELVDNATAFSPPESRVELHGNVVGRGIVLEVEDQGLGIEQNQRDEFNAMLVSPPEFSVMTLSEEPRLGLFVVARLAARHGVTVTLRESAYGGTRAIVLLRTELIHSEPVTEAVAAGAGSAATTPPAAAPAATPAATDAAQVASNGSSNGTSNGTPPPLPSRRSTKRSAPAAPPVNATRPELPTSSSNGNGHGSSSAAEPSGQDGRHHWPDPRQTTRHENAQQENGHSEQGGQRPPAQPPQPPQPPQPQPQQQQSQPQQQSQQGLAPDRPALPQRRRQQHIAPQLREAEQANNQQAPEPAQDPAPDEASPDIARHRLAAFQRGTRQAREEEA